MNDDLIRRQAAIERATKEHDFYRGASIPTDKARRDELLNVISWLNELPSAGKAEYDEGLIDGIDCCISFLSTFTPTYPKKGKWIWKGEDGDSRFMCSVCKWKEDVPTCNGVPDIWQYCPSCGARMENDTAD